MQKVKAAVVVNPASGNGKTGRRWPDLARALTKAGISYEHRFTEAPGHAEGITRHFLREGNELIISVGGDGTANEVVNGYFCGGKAVNSEAAVGFISTGTGRDLGRTIDVPKDYNLAALKIAENTARPVDVGLVTFSGRKGLEEKRYFINVAGLGLDGDTVDRVNRTSKALGGFVSFLWGTLISLLLYSNKVMQIKVDDRLICDEPVTVVVVGNGRFFGGGMEVAPEAEIDDGFFDIIILRNLSKPNLLVNLPRVYRGSHLSHPRITSLRGKKVEIVSAGTALLNLDGEQPGQSPAVMELLPRALKIRG